MIHMYNQVNDGHSEGLLMSVLLVLAFRNSNGCFEQYAELPQKSAKDV